MRLILNLCLLYLFYAACWAYRPVVVIHGVMSSNSSLLKMKTKIEDAHPGTNVYIPDNFANWSSLMPMWHQILNFGSTVMNLSYENPEGINLIGFSQGGLVARGILEAFPDHNVKTFISLSAPQGGQYGVDFLRLVFQNLSATEAYRLFYSEIGQHVSVGNYWRDPVHEKLYLKYSKLLPYLNNDAISPDSLYFKSGITRLEKMVLIGGPDDGVIGPWQSSHFAYYDEDCNVVDMHNQKSYQHDTLGLKTLNDSKRLHIVTVAGVHHTNWHENETVINNYIIPNLD